MSGSCAPLAIFLVTSLYHSKEKMCSIGTRSPLSTAFSNGRAGKWNKWGGFRSHLCIYRLNWTMRIPWGWWDEWGDTALQIQDSKFKPWRSEVEHAFPTILNLYEWAEKKHFVSLKIVRHRGGRARLSQQAALTTAPGPLSWYHVTSLSKAGWCDHSVSTTSWKHQRQKLL